MDTDVLEALKETKTLVAMLDSLALEDVSDDLSDAIYESSDVLDNLVRALKNESIGR